MPLSALLTEGEVANVIFEMESANITQRPSSSIRSRSSKKTLQGKSLHLAAILAKNKFNNLKKPTSFLLLTHPADEKQH